MVTKRNGQFLVGAIASALLGIFVGWVSAAFLAPLALWSYSEIKLVRRALKVCRLSFRRAMWIAWVVSLIAVIGKATWDYTHALAKSGMARSSARFRAGTQYLLRTQLDDGTWYVRSRAIGFQPCVDSGFPHGPDHLLLTAGAHPGIAGYNPVSNACPGAAIDVCALRRRRTRLFERRGERMHGLIFEEIRRYAEDRLGPGGWTTLLDRAGLSSKAYDQVQAYPDAEALQLVTAASQITGLPAAAVLEDFGEFVAPDLLRLSAPLVNRAWKTLDLLENTEETIHRVVRLDNPGADPPALHVTRTGPRSVVIVYSSPRKMCALAKGICKGVAKHYQEAIALSESRCMHNGERECHIEVELQS